MCEKNLKLNSLIEEEMIRDKKLKGKVINISLCHMFLTFNDGLLIILKTKL